MEVAKKLRSYFISLQREDQQQKRCFGRYVHFILI
jgi:hypothetical protein